MKGIPIKFRVIDGFRRVSFMEAPHTVENKEISQLLGYDVDGAEIYEGDEIESTDLLTGKNFRVKAGYCGINYAHFNFKLANKKSPKA